ncbi:hypothetical protein JDS79_42095 [Bacillus cereus]|nr:hypothetical protein [Bacillus cereus]
MTFMLMVIEQKQVDDNKLLGFINDPEHTIQNLSFMLCSASIPGGIGQIRPEVYLMG